MKTLQKLILATALRPSISTVALFERAAHPPPTWALLAFSLTTVVVLRRRRHQG